MNRRGFMKMLAITPLVGLIKPKEKPKHIEITEVYYAREMIQLKDLLDSSKYIIEKGTGLVLNATTRKPIKKKDWPYRIKYVHGS